MGNTASYGYIEFSQAQNDALVDKVTTLYWIKNWPLTLASLMGEFLIDFISKEFGHI